MKILLFRRLVQFGILALFVAGNFYGIKILSGDFSSSLLFDKISLADPFAVIQLLLAGMGFSTSVILGSVLVLVFYVIIAPRAFCGWVCPINIVSDLAFNLRLKLGFENDKSALNISRNFRYILLVLTLLLSLILGVAAFEMVSFVGLVSRGIVFLQGSVVAVIGCILVFDMFILKRGVCNYICPLGAFYAVVSKFSLLRVKHDVSKCTNCAKCLKICPENHVLDMIAKRSDIVKNSECISCGRCIDVCEDDALGFSIRNLRS